jgi:uncharacterized protein YndB with AHSA1/START domain
VGHSKFVYVVVIRSTREKIWDALTKPEFTRQYWAGTTQKSDWKKGSSWEVFTPDGRLWDAGEIVESDFPSKLVLTWRKEPSDKPFLAQMHAEGFSRLTYELKNVDLGVQLTLTHEMDVDGSKLIGAVSEGWPSVLSSLKTLLETGTPLPNSEKWPEGL